MKRFVYAAAAIVLTSMLVLLAMAVAQRDARISDSSNFENALPYANQPAQPISSSIGEPFSISDGWPPSPLVRSNDSTPANYQTTYSNSTYSNSTPAAPETVASYNQEGSPAIARNDAPSNTRRPNSSGRLAEPPPFNAINNFLTPSNGGLGNGGPAMNPLLPSPSSSSSKPGGFPQETFNQPLVAPPSLASPPPVSAAPWPNDSVGLRSDNAIDAANPPSLPSSLPPSSYKALPSPMPVRSSSQDAYEPGPVATLGMPMSPNAAANSSTANSSAMRTPDTTAAAPIAPMPTLPNSSAMSPINSPSYSANASGPASNAPTSPKSVGFASAAPGMRQLDGSQNPSIEIQKRAPHEVQVGIPATFTLLVRNVGNSTAYDVSVVDAVPKGARLIRTSPQAQQNGINGLNGLNWKIGDMPAGAEQTITIELEPETEGEIGSVASVNFAAQASVRTMSTQPKLVVKQLLEPSVLGGQALRILINVSNIGTGTARNVRLEEDVPQNMRHASGSTVLERSIGDLAPGESLPIDIELTAVSAGKVSNIVRAIADNATANESAAPVEVVSPKLQIGLEGPKLRYLERQATYTVSITNTGTAMAADAVIKLFLPSGIQFNSTENEGMYRSDQHVVEWGLVELAAGQTAKTKVTLLPVEEGDFVLRMQADANSVRAEAVEKPVRIEGQSELAFSIEDDNDPIETDGKTTYLIKITNTGTRVDNDVQLLIELPDGATVENVNANVNYQVGPRSIQFAPIAQMKSKEQQTIRMDVRHSREGTHLVRAQLKSKLRPGAVVKEESTQVYRDQ